MGGYPFQQRSCRETTFNVQDGSVIAYIKRDKVAETFGNAYFDKMLASAAVYHR
jgi:hypothetical protein